MEPWTRIPTPIQNEEDRRALCAILTAHGLEVRVTKDRQTKSSTFKRYIEYRPQETTP